MPEVDPLHVIITYYIMLHFAMLLCYSVMTLYYAIRIIFCYIICYHIMLRYAMLYYDRLYLVVYVCYAILYRGRSRPPPLHRGGWRIHPLQGPSSLSEKGDKWGQQ